MVVAAAVVATTELRATMPVLPVALVLSSSARSSAVRLLVSQRAAARRRRTRVTVRMVCLVRRTGFTRSRLVVRCRWLLRGSWMYLRSVGAGAVIVAVAVEALADIWK